MALPKGDAPGSRPAPRGGSGAMPQPSGRLCGVLGGQDQRVVANTVPALDAATCPATCRRWR